MLKQCFTGDFLRKHLTGLFGILVVCCLAGAVSPTAAQNYAPLRYWTFDGATPLVDQMGNFNLNASYYGSPYAINTNPNGTGVQKYLTLDPNSTLIQMGQLAIDSAFTIEFLFKPGYLFGDSRFFTRVDGAMEARMGYPYINFTTNIIATTGGTSHDELQVDLNQIGRRSYGYFMDGNWHHIVFRYNAKTGAKEIWVDGQCPAGYSKTTVKGYFNNSGSAITDLLLNTQSSYVKYHGDLDEIAVYNYGLPDNMIYKHYIEFTQNKHYTFNYTTTAPPAPASVAGSIDATDYAPGHPNVSVSTTDQLLKFPTPRYKAGHTLRPNIPLYGVDYLGGLLQSGISYTQALNEAKIQQRDLITHFNQSLQIAGASHEYTNYGDTTKFAGYFLNLANQNPQWHASINTLWPQLNPSSAGFRSGAPYVTCGCNSNSYYFRDGSGNYLDIYGNVSNSSRMLSPASPTDSLQKDGLTQRFYLSSLTSRLTRPLNLIFENGEVLPFYNSSTILSKDPNVVNDKNSTGLDWYSYEGRRAKEKALAYRNQFMNLPQLANTTYAYYQVDGQPTWRLKYSEMRQANSMINGQYYPTGDIYMRYPNNWRYWMGAWHGWQWVVESRKVELSLGDKLFSPTVSAGWDADEESNVRPGQWLGMLKAIAMTGAEFFYPSYFNLTAPYNPSKNWVWQVVMPAYAQAVTSRYEDLLRNGYLMEGDVPNDPINPQWNAYSFKTGDFRKLVVVRKHNTLAKYAITGTLQPNSNMIGNSENEGVATITLDSHVLKFKVRKQGSTYIYDNTNTAAPVFYQLDEWHESTHPYYWSKDFVFESELYDNSNIQVSVKTSVPAGTAQGDYTNFTSYITFASPSDVVYNFTARKGAPTKYFFWVRARSLDGSSTGLNVSLNGLGTKQIDCIRDTNWVWYRYDITNAPVAFTGITAQDYQLIITALNTKLLIDKVALVESSSAVYGTATTTCSTSGTATITAGGPTSFCQGGSVTLSANSGIAYLWSNGLTTQSINATVSGNYTVSVTAAGGASAVSSPVTVTVYSLPAASVSAGGSTTFCQGGSVTLTAPAASSYLWTPGNQTSQAISVTNAGTYSVRITNSNGCSSTSSGTTVTVNTLPTATTTPSGNVSINSGSSTTLTASSGSSYLWSPGGQTTSSINVNSAGSYTVRVTNGSGCSATSSAVNVTINGTSTPTITAGGPTSFCQGGSVTLTASAGASYYWSNGLTTQSITATVAGGYTVSVTSAGGTSANSAPITLTVYSPPSSTVTPSGATTFCQGGSVTLSAPSAGSYLWSPGNQTTQSISATASGTYSVKVTSSNGCTANSPGTSVTVNALPTATTSPSGNVAINSGSSTTLTASSGSSYLWSPGGQTTASISVNSAGSYTVRVTNSNGCSATSAPVNVTVNGTGIPTITANGPTSFCQGGSVVLTASPGAAYFWSNGLTTQSITATINGGYTVSVTSAGGTSANSAPINLTVYSLPSASVTAGGSTTFCQGGSVNMTAGSASSYLWSPGNQTTQTIAANASGSYSVKITNSNGCTATSSAIAVNVNPAPSATTNPSGNITINSGSSTTITASSASSYSWLPGGQTSQSISVSSAGTYSVKVTNSYGCSAVSPNVTVSLTTSTTCDPPYGLITTNVLRNSATLAWTNPNTGQTDFSVKLRNMTTGQYYYTGNVPSTTTAMTVGANSSTTYRWWVRSFCGSLRSAYAGFLTYTTPAVRVDGTAVTTEPLYYSDPNDDDGPFIKLEFDETSLYPNPASTSSTLSFYTASDAAYTVTLSDISGKVVYTREIHALQGFNLIDLDLSTLSKGVYMVRLSGDSLNVNKRLSVQ
ncbi:MAG TPA: T9SS type A sorting domain-containing protein [Bacteroidia bacterium]|nr:T9SS type A sorting domain-containing protein [Bacteroidia bacterium]